MKSLVPGSSVTTALVLGAFVTAVRSRVQVLVSRLFSGVPSLLLAGALALGCQQQLIPNTDVEDTPENRALVDFCEKYRKAVEHKNVAYLLQIAHQDYYEDGGNADSSDDMDRAGLDKYLHERFATTKGVRYEVRYRRVGKGRNDRVYVDYTYSASYQVPTNKGDMWRRTIADNRLELVPNKDSFLVIAGM